MQLKSLSLLAGACALALTVIPFAAQAQINSASPLLVAQGHKRGPWASLNLRDDQKAKIREIERNARAQSDEVFTPEQKAKLEAARQAHQAQRQQGQPPQAGEHRGRKFADLNLTDDQKTRLREIRQSAQQQIEALLDDQQRAKLQELKANARQRWQQRQQQNGN